MRARLQFNVESDREGEEEWGLSRSRNQEAVAQRLRQRPTAAKRACLLNNNKPKLDIPLIIPRQHQRFSFSLPSISLLLFNLHERARKHVPPSPSLSKGEEGDPLKAMEVAASTRLGSSSSSSSPLAMACGRSLSKKSASFRLHSPSLNSLRLRRIFDLFDKNGDGVITAGELGQALASLGLDANPSEVDSAVISFVKPGCPGLEFDDFVLLHQSLDDIFPAPCENGDASSDDGSSSSSSSSSLQEERDLSEAFKVFDEDGDGFISARELQAVLSKLGLSEGQEIARVQQMIVSVDRNHDGLVDFFEFKDMMRGVIATIGS